MYPYEIITTLDDYADSEKVFLKDWVENSFFIDVRKFYKKNRTYDILETMFQKYDSKYSKYVCVYRGMFFKKENVVSKELYIELHQYFTDAYKNDDTIRIDYAPSSFSLDKIVAENFSKYYDTYYYSIVFKLKLRTINEIDVCSSEHVLHKNEEELILQTHKMIFKILKLTQYNDILEVELKEI